MYIYVYIYIYIQSSSEPAKIATRWCPIIRLTFNLLNVWGYAGWCYAGWCPPVINWFTNPINYCYIFHKTIVNQVISQFS